MTESHTVTDPQRPSSLRQPHPGVRVIVTGQVGLDKKPLLDAVVATGRERGREILLFNVGDRMYSEAPDIAAGRILDLARPRLATLRRSVFKDILSAARSGPNLIVNTHATFRWKHGLFHAFDHDQMVELNADLYITLVDNVDTIHERLRREHDIKHSLKDILVWREEEIVVTETMAEALRGYGHAYVMSRGNARITAQSLYRLMFEPQTKRVYPSFPMTFVMDLPETMREIERFRDCLAEHFIVFDPADVDEKRLIQEADAARTRGESGFDITTNGQSIRLNVDEVTRIAGDIDGQIYARDFKLIDQSDMIVSYIPVLPNGKPVISSGVERELQHAFENTKEVYVIWKAEREPSPFVTETATKVFPSTDALLAEFQQRGYIRDYQLPLT